MATGCACQGGSTAGGRVAGAGCGLGDRPLQAQNALATNPSMAEDEPERRLGWPIGHIDEFRRTAASPRVVRAFATC